MSKYGTSSIIIAIANAIASIFNYFLAKHNSKNDKKKKIDTINQKLEDVCDTGSMSDLIDVAKEIGDAKK